MMKKLRSISDTSQAVPPARDESQGVGGTVEAQGGWRTGLGWATARSGVKGLGLLDLGEFTIFGVKVGMGVRGHPFSWIMENIPHLTIDQCSPGW